MRIRSARRKQVRRNLKRQQQARVLRLQKLERARVVAMASKLKTGLAAAGHHVPSRTQAFELLSQVHGFADSSAMKAALAAVPGA